MAIFNERAALLPSNVLTIDSTLRTISIPEKICNLGVETDANVQRLRFVMPRYYDTVDLDGFAIRINYQNAKGEGDVYPVTDAESTADTITFSWLVGPHAMACKGKVKFIVCLKKLDAAGNVTQAYHTTLASLPVLEGLETCECIVEEHPDVLEQILLRLDDLEKNGTGTGSTGGNSGSVVASGVTYLESPDADGNYLYLRDLETGPYVLAGYFRPFEGSSHSLGFSNAIVSVTKKDAGSHVMVLTALNCIVNFLEILVDDTAEGGHTYTRTNIKLPEVWEYVANGVKRIISNATDGYTNLRDLTSGVYILDGYFPMYEGAASRLAFGGTLANVAADDTGSHILAMSTVNGKMDFVTIEVDDTQESGFATSRTNISLPEMWAHTSNGVQYVESLDESNLVNLRDLTDGPYILYGYFHPYEGAPDTIPFDRAFASVINLSAGSHIMAYNPRNFKFDCYEVLGNATDGYTYTLENIGLLDLHTRVAALESGRYVATNHGISTEAEDNTPALQALVDEVAANGGGTIWFPVGTYNFKRCGQQYDKDGYIIDYAVTLKSGVSIMGASKTETVLRQTESVPYALFFRMATATEPLTGCTFADFTVDAYSTGNTNQVYGKAFYAQYLRDCTFRDLRLCGTVATGLGVDYLDRVVVDCVDTIDCGRTWTGTQGGSSGIGIGTGGWKDENFVISNCVTVGSGQFGVFVENQYNLGWGGNHAYSKGCIISGCITRGGLNHGIGIRGGENITIVGCESYENAANGVYLDGKCKNIHIESVGATANAGNGIWLGPDAGSKGVTVRGCSAADNTGDGIRVATASDALCIQGNNTRGNTVGISTAGVVLNDCAIWHNIFLDGTDISAEFTGSTAYIDVESTPAVTRIELTGEDLMQGIKLMPDGSTNTEDMAQTTDYLDVSDMGESVRISITGSTESVRVAQYDAGKNSLVTAAGLTGIAGTTTQTLTVDLLDGCAYIRAFFTKRNSPEEAATIQSIVVEPG